MKNLTWQNPEQLFVAQVLINKVKSKCCGIKEEQKQLMRAKDIIREAINNYPPEMPGLEDEYPPFCSIRIHRLLCEAESLLLNVAKKGNAEAQMLLADLYISAFETPQKKKGFFWLKKAVAQNYLPAIQMLREVNH